MARQERVLEGWAETKYLDQMGPWSAEKGVWEWFAGPGSQAAGTW